MGEGRIKLTINGLGQPKIEAEGFVGRSCADATAGLERALSGGSGKTNTVHKPEYFAIEEETEKVHQTWG